MVPVTARVKRSAKWKMIFNSTIRLPHRVLWSHCCAYAQAAETRWKETNKYARTYRQKTGTYARTHAHTNARQVMTLIKSQGKETRNKTEGSRMAWRHKKEFPRKNTLQFTWSTKNFQNENTSPQPWLCRPEMSWNIPGHWYIHHLLLEVNKCQGYVYIQSQLMHLPWKQPLPPLAWTYAGGHTPASRCTITHTSVLEEI